MDFDPTKGHEQRGRRPAVIVSNEEYARFTGLCMVCPITNNTKDFPMHVKLDNRTHTTGAVLCEHIRAVDLAVRNAEFKEKLPKDIVEEVMDIIKASL